MVPKTIGIAVIGAGMAGAAHAAAWRSATATRTPFGPDVKLVAIADIAEPLAHSVAGRFGYQRVVTDWRELLHDPHIHVVSVVVANHLHREIVQALAAAGKHVLCEKPLSATMEDARAMAKLSEESESILRIGFTFRRAPGLAALRELVQDGTLGEVYHLSGQYFADYGCSPKAPMTWRFRGGPGSGALADVGSHLLYAAEFLAGPMRSVSGAKFRTLVTERPVAAGNTVGHGPAELTDQMETVSNDDWAGFSAEFDHCSGVLQASRVAAGHPNGLRLEISCQNGGAQWDQENPSEIKLFLHDQEDPRANGFRVIKLGPSHPYIRAGYAMSAPGIGVGQNDGFIFQARAFLEEVAGVSEAEAWPRNASFAEGLHNMELIEAIAQSAASGGSTVRLD